MREFDVVVLGAGCRRRGRAGRLGEHGLSVAIVEDRLVGGECSYYACMPSKALLRPIELTHEVARVPGLEHRPDRRRRGARPPRRGDLAPRRLGQLPWLEQRGVTLVRGRGVGSTASAACVVGDETLVARQRSRRRDGLDAADSGHSRSAETRPWTNIEATTATSAPAPTRDPRRRGRRRRDGPGLVRRSARR